MCDMLFPVDLAQLGPISVPGVLASAGPLGPWLGSPPATYSPQACRTDSLHVPLSLIPSSHHSLPHWPTPLFPLSSYKPHFLLCQIRIVHRQLWCCHVHYSSIVTRHQAPVFLVSPDYLVSYPHFFFHGPHCTIFLYYSAISPTSCLPRVCLRQLPISKDNFFVLFSHSDVFPYTFRREQFDSDLPEVVCATYIRLEFGSIQCRNTTVLLVYPPVRFCKFSVRS